MQLICVLVDSVAIKSGGRAVYRVSYITAKQSPGRGRDEASGAHATVAPTPVSAPGAHTFASVYVIYHTL